MYGNFRDREKDVPLILGSKNDKLRKIFPHENRVTAAKCHLTFGHGKVPSKAWCSYDVGRRCSMHKQALHPKKKDSCLLGFGLSPRGCN